MSSALFDRRLGSGGRLGCGGCVFSNDFLRPDREPESLPSMSGNTKEVVFVAGW